VARLEKPEQIITIWGHGAAQFMEEKTNDVAAEVALATGAEPVDSQVASDATKPVRDEAALNFWLPMTLSIFAFVAFYFTTKPQHEVFDYTYRVAGAFLQGRLGFSEPQPSWLNEFVPMRGGYYSVFPLGAVLANLPLAVLGKMGLIKGFPARALASVLAAACVYFFFQLSSVDRSSFWRRILLAFFPVFTTWTWCNLGFAGAWQIALGFALVGETAALYFTLLKPRPLIAGAWFALAVGNRTELGVTLPVFLYFWMFCDAVPQPQPQLSLKNRVIHNWRPIGWFLLLPVVLGLATAAYNFARFGSVFDFGYARIPNLMKEPWYSHGLFSIKAVPWNMQKMLFEGFGDTPEFPYFRFYPFGCSIFLASPFLFLLFREGGKYGLVSWLMIGVLTFVLWYHGNPGGWQFSYRYATVLLPWMFLLISGNGPKRLSATEVALFVVSVAINAIATYQFLWTSEIHP
jgi:hypothetical protein